MSVFRRDTLIEEGPAFNIHTRETGKSYEDIYSAINLIDNEVLIVGNRTYYINSVVGYALENGDDPIEAYNREVANGFPVHWINQRSATLTSHKREAIKVIKVIPGETLARFHGQVYLIEKSANDNLALTLWEG